MTTSEGIYIVTRALASYLANCTYLYDHSNYLEVYNHKFYNRNSEHPTIVIVQRFKIIILPL